MKKLNLSFFWLIPFGVTFILLILHLFSFKILTIDNTTLILLAILLISPLSLNLKKIKFGDFEAEINSEEVNKVVEKIDKAKEKIINKEIKKIDGDIYEFNSAIQNIHDVFNVDPILALAKLRIELEKIINKIFDVYQLNNTQNRQQSLLNMVRVISQHEIVPKDIIAPLKEVLTICNRAIHGEEISNKDANSVIESGAWILEVINNAIKISDPIESKVLSNEERDKFFHSKYKVVTVIPYVDNPKMNTYIFTKEMLDNFLEGYQEIAEFIIDVAPINE